MNIIHDPDSFRRIRLVCSLIFSYGLSFIIFNIFFLNGTPELNPQAFNIMGERANSIKTGILHSLSEPTPAAAPSPAAVINQPVQPTLPVYTPATQVTAQPTVAAGKPTQSPITPFPSPAFPTRAPTLPFPTAKPTIIIPTQTPIPQPTRTSGKVTYAQFGQCLKDKGMVMYMSATCSLCSQQKKTLKDAYNYIRSVDCNASQQNGLECSQVGVRGLPTWGKNGKAVLSGPQTNDALAEEAGCQPPTE